jgi:iron complex transport system ATP-binding protein
MNPAEVALACRALHLRVGDRVLCDRLDFDARPGQFWAIVGPNGAGKTTLLRTLAGLRAPDDGTIAWNGRELSTLAPREQARFRAWLAETSTDFFAATALEAALVGRHPHLSRWQWESATDIDHARAALARFGVAACADRDLATLSSGERRRVALAAMLAQDASLLLLDEPSAHLDLGQQIAAFDVLAGDARDRGRTIVMVVHDLHLALRYADHAIAIGGGSARAGTVAEVLTPASMSALFGRELQLIGDGRARAFVPV